jgi:hypothetical protein
MMVQRAVIARQRACSVMQARRTAMAKQPARKAHPNKRSEGASLQALFHIQHAGGGGGGAVCAQRPGHHASMHLGRQRHDMVLCPAQMLQGQRELKGFEDNAE